MIASEVQALIHFAPRVLRAAILLAAALCAFACSSPDDRTGDEQAADRAIAQRVEAALHRDPYLDADHIEVDTHRGVVRLSGLVGSDTDLRAALRISAAVPGVRRVIDDLELMEFGRAKHGS